MIETAILCLALNLYHEARGEQEVGQWAVAQVTLNRAGHNPEKVCDAVFAPSQFSWANPLTNAPSQMARESRAERFMPREKRAWGQAKRLARKAIEGAGVDIVGNATHYHATHVLPHWASSFTQVAQIGNHIFYTQD